MAKIFVSFYNACFKACHSTESYVMPPFYEAFVQGLQSAGNEILIYNHNLFPHPLQTPKRLKEKIKSFNPDLAVLFNNACGDITNLVSCPIVIYEVDSILYFHNMDLIKRIPERFKVFTPQKFSIPTIKERLGISEENMFWTPPFSAVQSENVEFLHNICFIGSKFTSRMFVSQWNRLQQLFPDKNETQLEMEILAKIKHNPFITEEELKTELNLTDKILRTLDVKNIIWALSDSKRIQTLSAVADLGLALYGTENWGTDLPFEPHLTMAYNPHKVYSLKHNQDIYNSSKLSINVNHVQAVEAFSWRVCDIMSSNSCLVTEYQPCLQEFFPDINIPTFTNQHEARELCIHLLKNESERADIVHSCQDYINKHYRFSNLLETMESALGISLKTNNKDTSVQVLTNFIVKNAFFQNMKKRFIMYAASALLLFPMFGIPCPFLRKRKWELEDLFSIISEQYHSLERKL